MASINNLTPTTETEAVNAMLSAIGEAPVQDADAATQADVKMALNILREATREVLNRRWRFNTSHNVKLSPVGTFNHSDGTLLNIFTRPSDLATFELTRRESQAGMDATLRPPREYDSGGTDVFFDRLTGRDGWPQADVTELYIDAVWYLDFEEMPETARRYATVVAARRFQQDTVGAPEQAAFSERDEQMALQGLMQDQAYSPAHAEPDQAGDDELGALNRILAAGGDAQVATLDALSDSAVQALNTLRAVSREVQSRGWRFNSERNYALSGVAHGGGTVFEEPSDLLDYQVSTRADQQGLDVILRNPRTYGGSNRVFADRLAGTDQLTVNTLYIDPVWFLTFSKLPSAAREYVTVVAARRVQAQRGIGEQEAQQRPASLSEQDEALALQSLLRMEGQAAQVFDEGAEATELESLNRMLSAIGQQTVPSLTALTPQAAASLNLLRSTSREVQARGWRFNTEDSFTLSGTAWNAKWVFEEPADLLSYRLTPNENQGALDTVLRKPRVYNGTTSRVFADRRTGSDGLDVDTLNIQPVWFIDFADLPPVAREYVTVVATRKLQARAGMDEKQAQQRPEALSEQDEAFALRALMGAEARPDPVYAEASQEAEIEALNQMLIATRQEPVQSLSVLSGAAARGLNTLRRVSREVQQEGWEFNSELGLELEPASTLVWNDTDGETTTLNVFTPPADLLKWELTRTPEQVSMLVSVRPSKQYSGGGAKVFYDRKLNRDGFDSGTVESLYIDAVRWFKFADLPHTAQTFIVALATRELAQALGVDARVTDEDVVRAYRQLKDDQGKVETHNFLADSFVQDVLGGRQAGSIGVIRDYDSPTFI